MEFCPTCGMMLQYEPPSNGQRSSLRCLACPYVYYIDRKIVKKQQLVKKQVEPIFSEEDGLGENEKSNNVTCPSCGGSEAYFKQIQIRSADEPMSIFYMCCNKFCKARWRED